MIIFSSSFDCDTQGKYFCLWHSLGVPFIVVHSCSHFNCYTSDSIFVCYTRCSLFDCDFLDVILFVELPSNPF